MLEQMTYEQVERLVLERLRGYRVARARAKVLKKQAVGMGLFLEVSVTADLSYQDKLQLLHKKLDALPENVYLSVHEQDIASTARAYLHGKNLVGLRSQIGAVRIERENADDKEDEAHLSELLRKMEICLRARRGVMRRTEEDVAIDRADRRMAAERELEKLRSEMVLVEGAIDALGDLNQELKDVIVGRYIEGKSVQVNAPELGMSEKTHKRREQAAIAVLGYLLGLSEYPEILSVQCRLDVGVVSDF